MRVKIKNQSLRVNSLKKYCSACTNKELMKRLIKKSGIYHGLVLLNFLVKCFLERALKQVKRELNPEINIFKKNPKSCGNRI